MEGLLKQIEASNQFNFYCGQISYLELNKAMGVTLTPEQEETYKKLVEANEKSKKIREEKFLEKHGEELVKLHQWLTEKFGNPFTRMLDQDYKSWRVTDWTDNCDQSEGITLDWEKGVYSIRFNQEDGYGNNVLIKTHLSNEYIYSCIENWK
jgi:hypothetical protein